jgi:hypothetical protein
VGLFWRVARTAGFQQPVFIDFGLYSHDAQQAGRRSSRREERGPSPGLMPGQNARLLPGMCQTAAQRRRFDGGLRCGFSGHERTYT